MTIAPNSSGWREDTGGVPEPRRFLDLAAMAAIRSAGNVEPNPLVGAVLVKNGRVIGIGHHRRFGGPHAEVDALASAARQGYDASGATMYVTLEPCCHTGKTPPCTGAILRAGVSNVIFATRDPAPASAGGAEVLLASGVRAAASDASPFAAWISAPFRKRVTTGHPWVIAKWAQTMDGQSVPPRDASRWISSPASRARVHRLRARVDAVLVGLSTAVIDDPLLTVRGVRRARRTPIRVILDTRLELPPASRLAQTATETPVVVLCAKGAAGSAQRARLELMGVRIDPVASRGERIDLGSALAHLAASHQVATLLVEPGPRLRASLLEADVVDHIIIHVAPTLANGRPAPAGASPTVDLPPGFRLGLRRRVGEDLELVYVRG